MHIFKPASPGCGMVAGTTYSALAFSATCDRTVQLGRRVRDSSHSHSAGDYGAHGCFCSNCRSITSAAKH